MGVTPPIISMPSDRACSTSFLLAFIFSILARLSSTTSAPSRADTCATSCATWPWITSSGISFGLILVMCPRRRATVATSMEVSPPPITTTRLPTCCKRPSLKARRNAIAVTQLGASDPGTGSGRPLCAPIPMNTASYSFSSCSIVMSLPTRVFSFASTPKSIMRLISASKISRGVRKPGMP